MATKKQLYKYTIRVRGASTTYTKEVFAEDEVVRNGIVYFESESGWNYSCSLANMVDIEVHKLDEKEMADLEEEDEDIFVLGHPGHVETVLPKEHE